LAADLLVTARSSFSGVAAILRRHTGECSSISIAVAAAAAAKGVVTGDSDHLPDGSPSHEYFHDVDYEPPAAKAHPPPMGTAEANAAIARCAASLAAVATKKAAAGGGAVWPGPGEGAVARDMDCPAGLFAACTSIKGSPGDSTEGSTEGREAAPLAVRRDKAQAGKRKHCTPLIMAE